MNSKFIIFLLTMLLYNTAVAEDTNRFYGSYKFSIKLLDESTKSIKSSFTSMNISDAKSPMQFGFVVENRNEAAKTFDNSRQGNYYAINGKYRIGASSIGVLYDKDVFNKYSQSSFSFDLNTDAKQENNEFVPYAYGYVGRRTMDNGRSADIFYGYSGIKRQAGRWGFFGALDIEHISWNHAKDDTSVILFKPRVRYFLDENNINAITIYGETGIVKSNLMQDSKISNVGFSLDYLLFEKTKLNIDLYSLSKKTTEKKSELNKGIKLELVKYF